MARRKNYFSFLDFNYTDGALDLFQNTIRGAFEYDAFTDDVFQAVVLTEPTPVVEDVRLLTVAVRNSFGADGLNQKFSFRVRILGDNSPHKFLPNPCDIEDSVNDKISDKIFNLIQSHTQVILYDNSAERRPKTGDVVYIKLERSGQSYNLARAKQYIGIAQDVDSLKVSSVGRPECANLADLFKEGGSIRSISTSLSPAQGTNEFFNLMKEHPAFSNFSENFLWGLTANAQAESGLRSDVGGDPESVIGKREFPPISKKCSWGYWQLNICSAGAEGDMFIRKNNLDPDQKREEAALNKTDIESFTAQLIYFGLIDKDSQFQYVAERMKELFPHSYSSETTSAYDAAYIITTQFEKPINKEEKGRQRGLLAEEMKGASQSPAETGES